MAVECVRSCPLVGPAKQAILDGKSISALGDLFDRSRPDPFDKLDDLEELAYSCSGTVYKTEPELESVWTALKKGRPRRQSIMITNAYCGRLVVAAQETETPIIAKLDYTATGEPFRDEDLNALDESKIQLYSTEKWLTSYTPVADTDETTVLPVYDSKDAASSPDSTGDDTCPDPRGNDDTTIIPRIDPESHA